MQSTPPFPAPVLAERVAVHRSLCAPGRHCY
jgi:hypothetical protein